MVSDFQPRSSEARKQILAAFPSISGVHLEAATVFFNQFIGVCRPNGYWIRQSGIGKDRKELWALAKLAGVNADAIAAKHFHDAGSIAPWAEKLYPKGIKWPNKDAAASAPAKKAAQKVPAKAAAKKAPKKLLVTAKKAVSK